MGIYIEKLPTSKRSSKMYAVTIHGRVIRATVTSSPTMLSLWIKDHLQAPCSHHRHRKLVVGLDIEWRPSFTRGVQNPVAIIQLCIKNCCLIFQLYQAPCIPKSLYKALENPNITYTGVKISGDAKKIEEDYGLEIAYYADIAGMAAEESGQKELRREGLKTLVEIFTGEKMDKPKSVAISNWEVKELTLEQVRYACADAYYSYKLGKGLILGKWSS